MQNEEVPCLSTDVFVVTKEKHNLSVLPAPPSIFLSSTNILKACAFMCCLLIAQGICFTLGSKCLTISLYTSSLPIPNPGDG